MLNVKPMTTAQLSDDLKIDRGNISRCMTQLESLGFIEVDRIEGRNKFYKSVTDIKNISGYMKK